MKKICFVCHGNICRSPMGEYILKHLLQKAGRGGEFEIVSRATHDDEQIDGVGNPIYPPAQRTLRAHGVPFEARHSPLLTAADYDRYDLILCMDDENMGRMRALFGGDPAGKCHKLMAYTGLGTDVADPWFTGEFETAYGDIEAACKKLVAML